jgi:polysaccharide export outer membrane protein
MRSTPILAVTMSILVAGSFAACRPQMTPATSGSAAKTEAPGILGPLDVLEIRVYDEPEISGDYRVDSDGTVTFPFVGAVKLAGLTPNSASTELTEALANGYLVNPVVVVFVKEAKSRQVFVQGEVKNDGAYSYTDGMTIVEAIALAGGVTVDAAANKVRITRRVAGVEEVIIVHFNDITKGDEPNVALYPDDMIWVPTSAI